MAIANNLSPEQVIEKQSVLGRFKWPTIALALLRRILSTGLSVIVFPTSDSWCMVVCLPGLPCVEGWRSPSIDRSMQGGTQDRAVTVADCQYACARRFPACVAINVVNLPSTNLIQCWLLPRLGPLISTADIDNYEIIVSPECQVSSAYSVSHSCVDVRLFEELHKLGLLYWTSTYIKIPWLNDGSSMDMVEPCFVGYGSTMVNYGKQYGQPRWLTMVNHTQKTMVQPWHFW